MGLSSKQQQIAVVGLLLGFALLLFRQLNALGFLGARRAPTPAPAPIGTASSSHPTIPQILKSRQEQEQAVQQSVSSGVPAAPTVQYTAGQTRDPFSSLLPQEVPAGIAAVARPGQAAPVPEPPDLAVRGVIWGGLRPQALIDDGVYDVGDEVSGATILAIRRDGITVTVQGVAFELGVSPAGAGGPGKSGYRPPRQKRPYSPAMAVGR